MASRLLAALCICSLFLSRSDAAAVELKTSDARLAAAFEWARRQALAYASTGDPVGDWYEAALPGRQAFCMRDTAHQSMGAQFLSLSSQTRNMLHKFAENISDARDWCSLWEINRDNLPSPADYRDDALFWYDLPANFDVLDASYRMYSWSGDRTYLYDPAFANFYRRTVHDYVTRWDLSSDSVVSRRRILNIRGRPDSANRLQNNRGIPGYEETSRDFTVGIDLLAAQYAGYLAYAHISQLAGDSQEASDFLARAAGVKSLVNSKWWDVGSHCYYSRVNSNGRLEGHGAEPYLLYFGAAEEGEKSASVLRSILDTIAHKEPMGIEVQSYLPEILYHYNQPEAAYEQILDLTNEDKRRREYPEVSYAVVGAVVNGLMGIEIEMTEPSQALLGFLYVEGQVITLPRLRSQTEWAEVGPVPVRANEIRVRHDGLRKSTLENLRGPSLLWKACFPGRFAQVQVDGQFTNASATETHGEPISCVVTPVGSGNRKTVATGPR